MQNGLLVRQGKKILLAALLAGSAVLALSGGVAAAIAPAPLSSADLGAIVSGMTNAINSAKASLPSGATAAQIDAAVSAAISAEAVSLASAYPNEDPESVAEAEITAAIDDQVAASTIGEGMGDAALKVGREGGRAIARAMAGVGTTDSITEFQAVVTQTKSDYGTRLADLAGSGSEVGAGGSGAGGGGGGAVVVGGTSGNTGGSGSTCLHASCN